MAPVSIEAIKHYVRPLIDAEEQLHFAADQVLFYQDHQPYGLYLIRAGKVMLRDESRGKGNEVLDTKGPGAVLGEDELTGGTPYRYTARAAEDTHVVFFPKSVLELDQAGHDRQASA